MVSLTAIGAGYIALALQPWSMVHAYAIDESAYNPVDDIVELDHHHPAYGAIEPDVEYTYVIPGVNDSDSSREHHLRRLEVHGNNIDHLKKPMVRNIRKLPTSGEAVNVPWPDDYWPTYEDGINKRWYHDDEPSPAEKYAQAFGLDVEKFMEAASRSNGVLNHRHRQQCSHNSECARMGDSCAIRRGHSSGHCIPGWFGLCHAWAAAAIMEPEPQCPVEHNGVLFRIPDLKGLLTQLYDHSGVHTVFTGARYNGPSDDAVDEYGRFENAARRDLNPGYFHVALTNIMGIFKRSFVVDVEPDSAVWNHPARSYRVLEMQTMSPRKAAGLFYQRHKYPFNKHARKIQYVRTEFKYITEAVSESPYVSTGQIDYVTMTKEYTYLLELDAHSNIIGGEWITDSHEDHPDFLWFAVDNPSMDHVSKVGLSYKNLKLLLDASINNCST